MAKRRAADEWRATGDPARLVRLAAPPRPRGRGAADPVAARWHERKLRLVICGLLRAVWHDIPDPRARAAVAGAEDQADGTASAADCHASLRTAWGYYREQVPAAPGEGRQPVPGTAAADVVRACQLQDMITSEVEAIIGQPRYAAVATGVVRDLFYGPTAVRPRLLKRWQTPTAVAIARGCYDARDFARLPVLADALEDAGCDSEPLLTHLRGPGPHVRGCWVVDAVLGM